MGGGDVEWEMDLGECVVGESGELVVEACNDVRLGWDGES